ncbi:hypothetical protein FA13DRAFT_1735790 [Coprinellus micaceus]|uniref:F-box domain-containing protein n=1 Tax=Coprinellus micaceus TaxID=71717 RepID=A0A4Y7T3H5_COPMI|nr:hypothetical protein FA13DRAFT_1735790 [Coprinellus micaceus]
MSSESPFSNYFNNNHAPSALEADGIAALIADRGQVASEIRARLEGLVKEVKSLQGQLKQHTHHIDKHKAIISASRRLSSDTLARIFFAGRGSYNFSPIMISHVSRKWRKVVLNIPSMWTTVSIHVDGRTRQPFDRAARKDMPVLEVISANFEAKLGTSQEEDRASLEKRSKSLGLYIKVTANYIHPPSREHKIGLHEELVTILEPSFSRWIDLDINVPSDSPLMRLLHPPGSSAVFLQSLVMDLRKAQTSDHAAPPESMIDLRAVRSLTSVSLNRMGQSIIDANVALMINWSMLAYLRLHPSANAHFDQHHVIPIFAACTNLRRCSLTFFDSVAHDASPERSQKAPLVEVIVPHLYRLDLYGSEIATRGMASKLNLPSLTRLSTMFNRATYPASEEESALVEWLYRFGDQLLEVSFDYGSLTQSALAYCLFCLPNVVQLSMMGKAYRTIYPSMSENKGNGPYSALIDDNVLESLTPRFDILIPPRSLTPRPGDHEIPESLTPRFVDHSISESLTPRLGDNKILESLSPRFDEGGEPEDSTEWEDLPCLCPRLQRLRCTMGSGEGSEKAFIQFILARYGNGMELELPGGVTKIDEVSLTFPYEKPQKEGWLDIAEEVNRAVDARAMTVDVIYTDPFVLRMMESIYEALN